MTLVWRFDPSVADPSGLVAIGNDLEPETLLSAYRHGVFPWYDDTMPICWWSPDPRAVIPLDGLHISRRLTRTLRSGRFEISFNRDFAGVMDACAHERDDGTWITPAMIEGYRRLHQLGHAQSIEVWNGHNLVGGLYGVTIGGFFAGESMFHRESDASKVAMVRLFERLGALGYALFDTQFLTWHTARMGGVEIERADYLQCLAAAVALPDRWL